ncbi:hypothetical protein GUJ93_ZPchr0010g10539 [Zizania palustris]|uniref:Uncharacterized protein n=1 Tax=Zizania palustris TaxID=103762 RepID=A0A8J5W9U1_ZIZPA|nr:hypothetical protein GUJ93_ZPchr0010g10539 [Zizania palustris]KAG8086422.1 hypothetical protein GUJ93_ZPchr0010g10539 [Zizania palustris]KAG8086423.1 hypothetical protein GUJ93_ZPchr0010g10539 [Zizania palustris]
MDPKAAAKSKRSHTVRARRAHQTPSAAAAHRQKRAETAASSAPRSRNLPSNWDRYDSDADDSEPPSEWTGEVAPRSKGADFAFLLEQARAQPRESPGLGVAWLAPQDSPFDFMQASTYMLEAKGEEILSWCEDDNFILEDDLAPNFEVPFLSMDLHALAAQLSKLKLSERLFLEKDLLPEDLAVASEVNQIQIQYDTSVESDTKDSLVHLKGVNIQDYGSNIHYDDKMKTDCQLQCFEEEKTTSLPKICSNFVHSDTGKSKSYARIANTVPGTGHSEGVKFEVIAAEEELDMLLNTLDGTHFSESNLDESFGNKSNLQDVKMSQPDKKVTSSSSSKLLPIAPLDDALDDLLSETSLSVQDEGFSEPGSTSKPTFNNDHNIDIKYTNQIDITTSIDDLVDDLLADTSLCLNEQKQTTSSQGQDNMSSASVPHSGPSNASDDFDSWFDSL